MTGLESYDIKIDLI
ncbi:hypothetical protein LIY48_21855 [Escherichia coli]|nr:hypothetical protein [Escherichia coli]